MSPIGIWRSEQVAFDRITTTNMYDFIPRIKLQKSTAQWRRMAQRCVNGVFCAVLLWTACTKEGAPDAMEKSKAQWIAHAFASLESGRYPRVKAVAWWHENFDHSQLRVDSSPESLQAYVRGVRSSTFVTMPIWKGDKLAVPDSGIYHAAYPDFGGTEDRVTAERIRAFEDLVEKNIVWAYFSNNWYDGLRFPQEEVQAILEAGKVPFIRMMPRTNFDEGGPDPNYTMLRIIDGEFDEALRRWATEAARLRLPLLVEFGAEVNGNWFPWNGQYNGGGTTMEYGDPQTPDGPERFRDAYRHIVEICRAHCATNITWFFHVNAYSAPEAQWNTIEQYYPGDAYVDWLGVSIYGPQTSDEPYREFSEILDDVYPQLTDLTDKPIAILEFAVTEL